MSGSGESGAAGSAVQGYLWTGLFLAALGIALAVARMLELPDGEWGSGILAIAGAGAAFLGILYGLYRTNRYGLVKVGATAALLGSVLAIVASAVLGGPWWVYAVAAVWILLSFLGWAWIGGLDQQSERLPCLIHERPDEQLAEVLDVQFGATWPSKVIQSSPFDVVVELQNCVDQERYVHVWAEPLAKGEFEFAEPKKLTLKPGERVRVELPGRPRKVEPGPARISLVVEALGPVGRRIRYWRAKEFEKKVSTDAVVIAAKLLVLGDVEWGGGCFLPTEVLPPNGEAEDYRESRRSLEARIEQVHIPTAAEIEAAARR